MPRYTRMILLVFEPVDWAPAIRRTLAAAWTANKPRRRQNPIPARVEAEGGA
jgi:hypothetical protein